MARRSGPRLITLTSDLGSAYAAQMKAVLAHGVVPGTVVDLAHDLRAHAVGEAAFVLRAMAIGFPAGTVHVAVIDPGVGGRRAPIAIECSDRSTLVGPDNGVLMPLATALGRPQTYRIDPARSERATRVGTTFDGRDVFAPAALLLAGGIRASKLGPRIQPRAFALPVARKTLGGGTGEVLHVDRFGNLVTNLPSNWLSTSVRAVDVRWGRGPSRRLPVTESYEQFGRGRAGLLRSSFGSLEIAVTEGNAARRFAVRVGSRVRVQWPERPTVAK